MDDSKLTVNDDEFHFTEAEEASSDTYAYNEDETGVKKQSKFNRRNVLIVIGIIIVALALYKLVEIFLKADNTKKTTAVTTMPAQLAPKENETSIREITPKPRPKPTVQIQSRLDAKGSRRHNHPYAYLA